MARSERISPQDAFRMALAMFASDREMAAAIGYSANAVSLVKRGRPISAKMAVAVEYATNRKIKREWLTPEVFGKAALIPELRQGQRAGSTTRSIRQESKEACRD